MVEFLAVIGVLLILSLLSLVAPYSLLVLGIGLAVTGLVFGSAAGFVYHWHLRAALLLLGPPPRAWWLSPVRHHDKIDRARLIRLRPWFIAGAIGFVVSIAGCVLAIGGVVKAAVWPLG